MNDTEGWICVGQVQLYFIKYIVTTKQYIHICKKYYRFLRVKNHILQKNTLNKIANWNSSTIWALDNGMGEHMITGDPSTGVDLVTGRQSCLDLFDVSRGLVPFIDKLIIEFELKKAAAQVVQEINDNLV